MLSEPLNNDDLIEDDELKNIPKVVAFENLKIAKIKAKSPSKLKENSIAKR